MGNNQGGLPQFPPNGGAGNNPNNNGQDNKDTKKSKKAPPKVLRAARKQQATEGALKLPAVTPVSKCRLRYLQVERIKDYLLIEKEFIDFFQKDKVDQDETSDEFISEDRKQVDTLRGMPIDVGTLEEIVNDDHAIVSTPHGFDNYVTICSFVDKDLLEPGATVLLNHQTHSIIGVLQEIQDNKLNVMKVEKAPLASYSEIGGLETQIQELKEAVELPLTHPEIYEDMGIKPPKGVILYGPPGTGKTLLAKAVANETSATFLRLVGSELVQSYSGEGPKLVRNLFKKAAQEAPSIVFIDEIDAIGTKRYNTSSGGAQEVQRTMLELLNQLDGFDTNTQVKVIMATNRIETLDPALIRPGRIDRKIELPEPDLKTKKKIFTIHTSKMSFSDDVKFDEIIGAKDQLSGADIKALCSEAGLLALRERRMKVSIDDFKKAQEKILQIKKGDTPEGIYI